MSEINFACPASLLPDELCIQVGNGGNGGAGGHGCGGGGGGAGTTGGRGGNGGSGIVLISCI
jgi:hypothetical protein